MKKNKSIESTSNGKMLNGNGHVANGDTISDGDDGDDSDDEDDTNQTNGNNRKEVVEKPEKFVSKKPEFLPRKPIVNGKTVI